MIVWLDANSDFYGAYENTEEQSAGESGRAGVGLVAWG